MINEQGNESKTMVEDHLFQRAELLEKALHKAEALLHQNNINSDFISDTFNVINAEFNITQ